jgi:hypothetical protein
MFDRCLYGCLVAWSTQSAFVWLSTINQRFLLPSKDKELWYRLEDDNARDFFVGTEVELQSNQTVVHTAQHLFGSTTIVAAMRFDRNTTVE